MTWSLLTSASETFSQTTSGNNETWTDNTASNTTARNTSRFLLLSPIASGDYVNFQPAVRSVEAGGRGAGFCVTTSDPVTLFESGQSTI